MSISKTTILGLAVLCVTATAWATDVACPGTATTLSTFGAGGAANGCTATDANFVNFSVDGNQSVTGNLPNVSVLAGTTSLAPTETFTNNNNSWTGIGGTGSQTVGEFLDALNTNPVPGTGKSTYFQSIVLTAAATLTINTTTLTVTQDICQGNVATCTGATSGVIILAETFTRGATTTTSSWTCNAGIDKFGTCSAASGASALTVNLFSFQNELTINTTISSGNNSPVLTNFVDSFTEDQITPEPSTFILMGSALAGVAALRFRKSKQA